MDIYKKSLFSSYFNLLKMLLLISVSSVCFLSITNISFAEGNNTSNYSTDSNSIPAQKDSALYLREPLLPGENTVDVGRENGAVGILANYISMVYRYVLALGGIIAVLVVMFAGFQIMTSGGSSEAQGEAKTMIIKTLMGVTMLFLAGLFLYAINPNFYVFGGGSNSGGGTSGGYSSSSSSSSSSSNSSSNSSNNNTAGSTGYSYDANN